MIRFNFLPWLLWENFVLNNFSLFWFQTWHNLPDCICFFVYLLPLPFIAQILLFIMAWSVWSVNSCFLINEIDTYDYASKQFNIIDILVVNSDWEHSADQIPIGQVNLLSELVVMHCLNKRHKLMFPCKRVWIACRLCCLSGGSLWRCHIHNLELV